MAGAEVSLSYLGLGIDPPAASFGSLISEAGFIRTFQQYPHLLLGAATPVVLFFYAWNLLGDALVDAGVRAILSYAPVSLTVPPGVAVSYSDPVVQLQQMTYHLTPGEE